MMLKKAIISILASAVPFIVVGQNLQGSANQSRPFLINESSFASNSSAEQDEDSIGVSKSATPFPRSISTLNNTPKSTAANNTTEKEKDVVLAMNSNNNVTTKVVKKAENAPVITKKETAKVPGAPLVRKYEHNGKYGPVPLTGELSYFKHNNDYMLEYTKKYAVNYKTRMASLTTSSKKATLSSIDKILDRHQIPNELKYLAVIESALNGNAESPVGAYGYWQFMGPTARLMGLKVTPAIDERSNLTKSTNAAAKYLSYLYDQFDDWLLVVAAYNSGPRPVINAVKRTGQNDYWSIKKYLPRETQNHVLAFIATATLMERLPHYAESGVPSTFDWKSLNINRAGVAVEERKPTNPLFLKFTEAEIGKMAIVRVNKPIDLDVLARELGVDRRTIGRWNYDYYSYLESFNPSEQYNLRIPKDKIDVYLQKKYVIEKELLEI